MLNIDEEFDVRRRRKSRKVARQIGRRFEIFWRVCRTRDAATLRLRKVEDFVKFVDAAFLAGVDNSQPQLAVDLQF